MQALGISRTYPTIERNIPFREFLILACLLNRATVALHRITKAPPAAVTNSEPRRLNFLYS